MSRQITTFYKGAEFVNRVSYATSGTNQALPSRSATILREWCQPINFADGTAEVPVLFTFPSSTVAVTGAYLNVRVAETTGTTKTITAGTATADSGTPNAFLNACDVSTTGIKTIANCLPATPTVPASTVAYTSVGSQWVTVTGGTTTVATVTRNGTASPTFATVTPFTVFLADGDQLKVTYSVAPVYTVFAVQDPDGIGSVASKRISWTPASNNFASLDADLVVQYLVMDDIATTQNTVIAMGPSD